MPLPNLKAWFGSGVIFAFLDVPTQHVFSFYATPEVPYTFSHKTITHCSVSNKTPEFVNNLVKPLVYLAA